MAALNECRLLVFLETEEGKFYQVALDEDQFEKVSAIISAPIPDEEHMHHATDCSGVHVRVNDAWSIDADTFLGLSSITETKDEEVG